MRNRMIAALAALAALAVLLSPLPVLAQPMPVPVAAGESWMHVASGIALPPAIGPFTRGNIQDISGLGPYARNNGQGTSEDGPVDVIIAYADAATQTSATVYIYHAAMPGTALWFDAAASLILANTALGTVAPHGRPAAFSLPGSTIASGLRQTFSTTQRVRSTGLAVVTLGEWMVKLRMSSNMMDPAQLDMTLIRFFDQMKWPASLPPMAATSAMLPCTKALPALARAEKVKMDSAAILLGSMVATTGLERAETLSFCRDAGKVGGLPIYRTLHGGAPQGNDRGYYIALGDAGRLLLAQQDSMAALMAKKERPYYRITLMTLDSWVQFPGYASLPSPAQAMEIFQQEKPLSITSVYGPNKKNVQISPEVLQK